MEAMNEHDRIMHELVLNWKLRLVVSAMFTILGMAFLISTVSGFFVELNLIDQTIVGLAVFVVMIPVYLIVADLPKIDEYTIAGMLNESVPELNRKAELILKPETDLSEEEQTNREQIEPFIKQEKLYRFLPNYPIKQAAVLLTICLILTVGSYFVLA